MTSWYAVTADGTARRVTGLGIVIGRAPSCDVVLDAPAISRRHVLLQLGGGQLEIVPLPGAAVTVNGIALTQRRAAVAGDALAFPGGVTVHLTADASAPRAPRAWLLDIDGRRIGLRGDLGLGGGGPEDDVVIAGWPAAAARFTWSEPTPALTIDAAGGTVDDRPTAVGETIAAQPDLRIRFGTRTVTLRSTADEPAPTLRAEGEITALALELLPSGGMLTVTTDRAEHRVLLAERRFALASILLAPPAPYRAGELIPDEIVFAAVWPRNASVDRGDINQLACRLRADLRAAGVTGSVVVERFAKGGATRFAVGRATIAVRT